MIRFVGARWMVVDEDELQGSAFVYLGIYVGPHKTGV